MADYGDILLEAVQTVVDGSLNKLQFDKTVICTIINNANAKKGEYTVTDGASTFLAYSDKTDYIVNTTVYVNIPNGDFSKQKLITGKYIGDSSDYYTYTSPWRHFVDITGDMVNDDLLLNTASILANGPKKEVELWSKKIENGKNYTSIGLKADFKAWLSGLGAEAGTYGLRLYIRTVSKRTGKNNTYKTYLAELSTLDMIGNPYAFDSFYNQQKVFDVSGMGQIESISLYLYQNNDFYDGTKTLIKRTDSAGNMLQNNIFVNSIYLALGYSLDEFNGDMAMLYTLDPDTYSAEYGRDDERNLKHLMVRWIHQDEKENIIAYTDSVHVGEQARIHWYKYKLDANVSDELAGAFWEEIPEYLDTFEQDVDCFDHIAEQEIQYKVIIETPVKEYLLRDLAVDTDVATANSDLEAATRAYETAKTAYDALDNVSIKEMLDLAKTMLDDATERYDKVTAQYVAEVKYIESDPLTLRNEQMVADLATLDLIQALTLKVDAEGNKGIYTLYDQTNQLHNPSEANTLRIIEANYKSTVVGDAGLDAAESITWMIPLTNTMIYPPEDGKEFDSLMDTVTTTDDGQYMLIERNGTEHAGTLGASFDNAAQQYFRIKKYFMESATNNTITCYVVKNQRTYEASASLQFGPMGTNGTDFTFVLSMQSDQSCLFKDDTDPIRVDASLYDYNNNLVPHAQGAAITYAWQSQDEKPKVGFCTVTGELLDSFGREIKDLNALKASPKLLQRYAPKVDSNDTHMYCFIRRLTDDEMRVLWGLKDSDPEIAEQDKIPYYYIMSASLTIDATSETKGLGKTELNTYLPIPYSASYDYTQIEGTTKIVYNSSGTNPYYYKDNYKLYTYTEQVPANTLRWDEKNDAKSLAESKFYPVIDTDGKIIPPSTYTADLSQRVAAVCYQNNNGENGDICWVQPIVILQDAYSSAMLNAWDGSLTIDEENGTIMSTMLGAGYKDKQNRYNGVLIGDVQSTADVAAGTGVYGYNQGVQSFGLNVNGTAFFGKAGKGQIQFDGNSSTIQSMSYKAGQSGMKIDLDDGFVDIRGNEISHVAMQKDVKILEATDFAGDLSQLQVLMGDKWTSLNEASPQMQQAIAILQAYNAKPFEELSSEEKGALTTALKYIQSVASAIRFNEPSLDEFLSLQTQELQGQLTQLLKQQEQIKKEIAACEKDTSVNHEDDLVKLRAQLEECEREIENTRQSISQIQTYNLTCEDIETYRLATQDKYNMHSYMQAQDADEKELVKLNTDFIAEQSKAESLLQDEYDALKKIKTYNDWFTTYLESLTVDQIRAVDENNELTKALDEANVNLIEAKENLNKFYRDNNLTKEELLNQIAARDSVVATLDYLNTKKNNLIDEKTTDENTATALLQSSFVIEGNKLKKLFEVYAQLAAKNAELNEALVVPEIIVPEEGEEVDIPEVDNSGTINLLNANIETLTNIFTARAQDFYNTQGRIIYLLGNTEYVERVKSLLVENEQYTYDASAKILTFIQNSLQISMQVPIATSLIETMNQQIQIVEQQIAETTEEKQKLDSIDTLLPAYQELTAALAAADSAYWAAQKAFAEELAKNNTAAESAVYKATFKQQLTEFINGQVVLYNELNNKYATQMIDYRVFKPDFAVNEDNVQTAPPFHKQENELLTEAELAENTAYQTEQTTLVRAIKDNQQLFSTTNASLTSLYTNIVNTTNDLEEQKKAVAAAEDAYEEKIDKLHENFTSSEDIETYRESLLEAAKSDILPKQLINSTTESPVYQTTKAQVRVSSTSPYFKIVDSKGQKILFIGDDNYYLQSAGYNESFNVDGSGGQGVKIDLLKNKINGYNFSFKSAFSENNSRYSGSYISLGSGGTTTDPYIRVHYVERKLDVNGAPLQDKSQEVNLLDITKQTFVLHSQNWHNDRKRQTGIELDLTKGMLKAFNSFDLKAAVTDDNSNNKGSYIQLSSSGTPFFRVHYVDQAQQRNLNIIDISNNNFLLQSQNWKPGKDGMLLDLTKGNLQAYNNFNLYAQVKQGIYKGSYIQLASTGDNTTPYLRIHYTKWDSEESEKPAYDLNVLDITKTNFRLQSQDWVAGKSGTQIDLIRGKISSYAFMIKAFRQIADPEDPRRTISDESQYIALSSSDDEYPFKIKGDKGQFAVGWDGRTKMNYLEATEGGQIGPFNIDKKALYIGENSFLGAQVYLGEEGISLGGKAVSSSVNPRFSVSAKDGSTYIGGSLSIAGDTNISGDLTVKGSSHFVGKTTIEGGGSISAGNGSWSLTSGGGTIGGWTISQDSISSGGGSTLGANGTIKLVNGGGMLTLSGSFFAKGGGAMFSLSGTASLTATAFMIISNSTIFSGNATIAKDLLVSGSIKTMSSLTLGDKTYKKFGDLAEMDTVEITSANFKLGTLGSMASLGTGIAAIDKNKATYTISLADQGYYKKGENKTTYTTVSSVSGKYYRRGQAYIIYTDGTWSTSSVAGKARLNTAYVTSSVTLDTDTIEVYDYTEVSSFQAEITVEAKKNPT